MRLKIYAALLALATLAGHSTALLAAEDSELLAYWDFENGVLPWNTSGNAPTVQTSIKRAGKYGMKSVLNCITSPTNYRTEITSGSPGRVEMNQEYWYGVSIYLPNPYPADSVAEVLAQWHASPDDADESDSPVLAFRVHDGYWKVTHTWNASQPTVKSSAKSYSITIGKNQIGSWTDWVVNAKWSVQSDGFLKVWQNGKLVVNYSGPIGHNDSEGPYFKMGIYKSQCKTVTPDVIERTVYHDEYRMAGSGGSYAAVSPADKSVAPKPPTMVSVE